MANNAARIREIDALLESGVSSVTTPNGQTTSFNHDTLRKERDRLKAEDDNASKKRPGLVFINLSGASA